MKVTVVPVPIQPGRFTLTLREPGLVRLVAVQRERRLIALRGEPEHEDRNVAFVEMSPNGAPRMREFVVLQQGEGFEAAEGELAEWRGSAIGPKGPFHLFEVLEAP